MIFMLSCFFFCLFLNAVLSSKGVGRKIFRQGKRHQDREIAVQHNKPPSVLLVAG